MRRRVATLCPAAWARARQRPGTGCPRVVYKRMTSTPVEGRPLEDLESTLVERARQGDADAYGALVGRYQDLAFRTAYLVVHDAAEAEDAAQEAFIRAYAGLARFRAGAPFRPWLLRIAANVARNRRRASSRRGSLVLRAAEARASGEAAPSPEAVALAAEQRRLLLAALNGLREDDRLAIAARYFLDLSEAEMAVALGCARGTVKSRLARALGRLRAELARTAAGEEEAATHG